MKKINVIDLLNKIANEIEIIEDTPNEDKKIKRIQSNGETLYSEYDELLMNKINEIIDKVNGDK